MDYNSCHLSALQLEWANDRYAASMSNLRKKQMLRLGRMLGQQQHARGTMPFGKLALRLQLVNRGKAESQVGRTGRSKWTVQAADRELQSLWQLSVSRLRTRTFGSILQLVNVGQRLREASKQAKLLSAGACTTGQSFGYERDGYAILTCCVFSSRAADSAVISRICSPMYPGVSRTSRSSSTLWPVSL